MGTISGNCRKQDLTSAKVLTIKLYYITNSYNDKGCYNTHRYCCYCDTDLNQHVDPAVVEQTSGSAEHSVGCDPRTSAEGVQRCSYVWQKCVQAQVPGEHVITIGG